MGGGRAEAEARCSVAELHQYSTLKCSLAGLAAWAALGCFGLLWAPWVPFRVSGALGGAWSGQGERSKGTEKLSLRGQIGAAWAAPAPSGEASAVAVGGV
eukprot:COSAG02_NODE_46622_length_347_cov_0.911290_1_plen_99_part_10